MLKVGLTGGIGSGKSTVAKLFAVLGVPVFSSDEAGRWLLNEDASVHAAVARAFGPSVMVAGIPDRKALAKLVFGDPEALARLNAIIHPAVRKSFQDWAAQQQAPYVVNESAILVETGIHETMDFLVVVAAPEAERIKRVVARDGVKEADVLSRMRNQATEDHLERAADHVLHNDGNTLLIPQVLALHATLLEREKP